MSLPLANSYWVIPGQFLAGEHPFGESPVDAHNRIAELRSAGIDYFLDLTEPQEMPNYRLLLPRHAEYLRRPIPDTSVPREPAHMQDIQGRIRAALAQDRCVYVHCRAGIGRTGTVVGCYFVEQGLDGNAALKQLNKIWKQSERSKSWPKIPQTEGQAEYIRHWREQIVAL
jgi:hypothetical protein